MDSTTSTISNALGHSDSTLSIPNYIPAAAAPPGLDVSAPNHKMGPDPTIGNGGESGLEVLVKRRPGRPKGSGKKSDIPAVPKIKRPVGRPRKDGLPAGSLTTPKRTGRPAGRPRKSAPARLDGDAPHGQSTFSPGRTGLSTVSTSNIVTRRASIRSNGGGGSDWAALSRQDPQAFIQALLSSFSAPNPVSSAGPSVEEAFKSHLVSLAPSPVAKQGPPSIPSLYSILKTFWLPSSPSYFALTASASTARVPSEHRFLYWDPQPLVFNGISCPNCSMPLINNGRIRSGPIKIYDLEQPFFVIGCEYVCKSPMCMAGGSVEGRKFASTDWSVLRSLPTRLKDEFPVYMVQGEMDAGCSPDVWNWEARGVSRSLWNMVRGCLQAGLDKDAIVQVVRGIQDGVDDDTERQEDEEEEEEQHDGVDNEDQHPSEDQTNTHDSNKELNDAYNNAWRANTAVAESSSSSNTVQTIPRGQMGGDPTAPAASQSGGPQYGFVHVGPYAPYPYHHYPYFAPTPPTGDPGKASENGHGDPKSGEKRTFSIITPEETREMSIMEPAAKRTRHCCKCGKADCKGKGGRSFCLNACQDCGKIDCRGRNSRRPDKKCSEAWT